MTWCRVQFKVRRRAFPEMYTVQWLSGSEEAVLPTALWCTLLRRDITELSVRRRIERWIGSRSDRDREILGPVGYWYSSWSADTDFTGNKQEYCQPAFYQSFSRDRRQPDTLSTVNQSDRGGCHSNHVRDTTMAVRLGGSLLWGQNTPGGTEGGGGGGGIPQYSKGGAERVLWARVSPSFPPTFVSRHGGPCLPEKSVAGGLPLGLELQDQRVPPARVETAAEILLLQQSLWEQEAESRQSSRKGRRGAPGIFLPASLQYNLPHHRDGFGSLALQEKCSQTLKYFYMNLSVNILW